MQFLLLAQAVVDSSKTMMSGPVVWLVGTAVTVFLGVASWALTAWHTKLSATADGTLKSILLSQIEALAEAAVARMNGTIKPAYDSYAKDGQITSEEAKQLAALALQQVKALLGNEGLEELKVVFGWGAAEAEQHISGVIEQKVVEAKPVMASAALSTPSTAVTATATAARP